MGINFIKFLPPCFGCYILNKKIHTGERGDLKMDEQKETETKEEKSTSTAENTKEGHKSETNDIVERADSAAKRMAEENERMEKNIRQLQELEARKALGGRSDFNQSQQAKEVESPEDYANRVLKGKI